MKTVGEVGSRGIRRAEVALHAVAESVEDGILLLDPDDRILLSNRKLARLLGIEVRRLAGMTEADSLVAAMKGSFRTPEDGEDFARHWREQRRRRKACCEELEVWCLGRRVVERSGQPLWDDEGEMVGWLEVYRDLSGQRLMQGKLLQTEKMAALGQLVSGIAHELNNPLTSIAGYAQLLLARRPGAGAEAEAGAELQRIHTEAERAARIVKNLLYFARETKPERRPVQLNEVVERTLALRSYELKLENIAVETDLPTGLPPTLADEHQLQQVMLNLIVNAEHAIRLGRAGASGTARGGRMRIRTREIPRRRLALEISDDGPGVPAEMASRIFDPFFSTKPPGVGTGLGLSICYGIVQEHGGEIYLANRSAGRDFGATFVVELPVTAPAETQRPVSRAVPGLAGHVPGQGSAAADPGLRAEKRWSKRILVVEDESTVAQLIVDLLTEEGHQVEATLDSAEGLRRILASGVEEGERSRGALQGKMRAARYDLVICDLKMPRLDGRALYEALVSAGHAARQRLLFITGDTLGARTLEFLEKNSLPYLAKPFLVEELLQAVNRQLEGSGDRNGMRTSPNGEAFVIPPPGPRLWGVKR